jgi:hypothetical protein
MALIPVVGSGQGNSPVQEVFLTAWNVCNRVGFGEVHRAPRALRALRENFQRAKLDLPQLPNCSRLCWSSRLIRSLTPPSTVVPGRSLGEAAMICYKTLIDRRVHARTLPPQKTESAAACKVINVMTDLGMPVSQYIA